ncbi:MAG: signal peptidase I [Planctomycetes bacterium]|nr:signal peptidase I [Planctomycetota bacterium]
MTAPLLPAPASDRPRPGDVIRNPLGMQRETVESVVIAFTLALLFRAFEAEAFVIPTGSMAPTLMGRHKDLVCSACGDDYRVGCSAEEDEQSQEFRARLAQLEAEADALRDKARSGDEAAARIAARKLDQLESRGGQLEQLRTRLARKLVQASRCGNCGHVMQLVEDTPTGVAYDPAYPSYNGDRVLVDKFSYDFREPRRWDVVVFKYPEDAKTNYIKRLVGLPGETVSIVGGDIWTTRDGQTPQIARKPPERLLAMLQCVHDTRHEAAALRTAGWPSRWTDWSAAGAAPGWTAEGTGFRSRPTGTATLRYRHLVASPDDWEAAAAGKPAGAATPALIDDFQPYNAVATRPHWVGDLAVEARLESRAEGGTVSLDLVEGGAVHRCTIDLATGLAELSLPGAAQPVRGTTPVRGRGRWNILLANVDDELTLSVDGRRVAFDGPTRWNVAIDTAEQARPDDSPRQPGDELPGDLAPAGITAVDADVTVRDIRVLRDVFYIGAREYLPHTGGFTEGRRLDFPLEADQFFVLGDNSAASKDSRLWLEGHHVDRHLLVGRALAVFWPHAVSPSWAVPLRLGSIELRLPAWPNFGRMRWVR